MEGHLRYVKSWEKSTRDVNWKWGKIDYSDNTCECKDIYTLVGKEMIVFEAKVVVNEKGSL